MASASSAVMRGDRRKLKLNLLWTQKRNLKDLVSAP